MDIFSPLMLPNGTVLKNRIAKAAMEENLADCDHAPGRDLLNLYKAWAEGGAGLIITGNVMIDSQAATGPGGVVLEDESHLERFQNLANQMSKNGAQAWMQINHPGRQMPRDLGQPTVAPSAVGLQLGAGSKAFALPRELTPAEIQDLIARFARTASLAEKAGFQGVEIHAAHGYLISQFLSPLSNKRQDQWGGSLENRSRFLFEVAAAVRSSVSEKFSVAVKLNSADFQRGGFTAEDAKYVVNRLNDFSIDLVEISGGSYEAPAMMGKPRDDSTLSREAYFLEFAKDIGSVAKMPVMVTGGIRRKGVAEKVIASGISVAGMATALALNPRLPNDWQKGEDSAPALKPVTWRNKPLSSLASMGMVRYQFQRVIRGKDVDQNLSPLKGFLFDLLRRKWKSREYRSWIKRKVRRYNEMKNPTHHKNVRNSMSR